jgi:hypothetical protein
MVNKLPGLEILPDLKRGPFLHLGQRRVSILENQFCWDMILSINFLLSE